MCSEETATTSSNGTNVSGASFLSPNRFDVGYGKSGYEKYNQNPGFSSFAVASTTPPTATATNNTSTTSIADSQQHQEYQQGQQQLQLQQYREKGEDEVGMDMS